MKISYAPIGIVHSPYRELADIPRQSYHARDVAATIEMLPQYTGGLKDLDGFSHLFVLCHFHASDEFRLEVHPPGEKEAHGLFATRSPRRPNPIGLSIVRLVGIEENRLSILDVDILDQTPVLDIKPYFNEFAQLDRVRTGWAQEAMAGTKT